jgi:hypothetical protein
MGKTRSGRKTKKRSEAQKQQFFAMSNKENTVPIPRVAPITRTAHIHMLQTSLDTMTDKLHQARALAEENSLVTEEKITELSEQLLYSSSVNEALSSQLESTQLTVDTNYKVIRTERRKATRARNSAQEAIDKLNKIQSVDLPAAHSKANTAICRLKHFQTDSDAQISKLTKLLERTLTSSSRLK